MANRAGGRANKPAYYADNTLEVLFVWQVGMRFHGGMLGVITAMAVFARRMQVPC